MSLSAPIHVLKGRAKSLKSSQGIPLVSALNRVAELEGYASWSLLASSNPLPLPLRYREILDFFKPGDLVLIGGRPSIGKTSFTIGIWLQAIRQNPVKHFLFTLDFTQADIMMRISNYERSMGKTPDRFTLDCSDDICAGYIIDKTKSEIAKGSVIVIDYLQTLDHRRVNPPLQEQVANLKRYARERGCILVFISQVSRWVDTRIEKRPRLDDVKLANPLDLKLFNKTLLLFRESDEAKEVEISFTRPKHHILKVGWSKEDSVFY